MRRMSLNFLSTISIVLIVLLLNGCTSFNTLDVKKSKFNNVVEYKYEDVKNTIIRFHVIANSDKEEDQKIKLEIKDKIISYIYPFLQKSNSIENSRDILNSQKENILNIASEILLESGYNYKANIEFSRENFPEKSYGNIILPQGEYEAFRIILGDGKGKNWWCVMFPPMCFIDVTKGKIEEDKSKEELDAVIENANRSQNNDTNNIKIKFKILEIFK